MVSCKLGLGLLLLSALTQAFHMPLPRRCSIQTSSSALRMQAPEQQEQPEHGSGHDRRSLLRTVSSSLAAGLAFLSTSPRPAQALRPPSKVAPPPPPSERPYLWQVLMSDPPQMQPYTKDGEKSVLQDMARRCNAVFLGEHADSVQDKALEAKLIDKLRRYKPRDASLTVGLEMVQQKFQPALDAYISKSIADEAAADAALKDATEWDARWPAPFETYLPVLHLARNNKLKLLALGLESEALAKVRQVGLEGLSEEERGMYVADPSGFIQSVKFPGFKLYAERYIMPSYAARAASPSPPSPAAAAAADGKASSAGRVSASKFLAARILWDESMATKAVRHLKDNPKDLIVMLVGADHIKFGLVRHHPALLPFTYSSHPPTHPSMRREPPPASSG